jgi:hypothetical protein
MTSLGAAQWKLFGAAIAAVVAGFAPAAARAATTCERWDVSGPWTIVQDNGAHADIVVTQGDTIILGSANSAAYLGGNFDGTLVGPDIRFTIYWNSTHDENQHYRPNDIGDYVGTISPTGRITGTTSAQGHPEVHARWFSSRAMGCAHWVTAAPPAPAKPSVALGRVQPPAGAAPAAPMTICQRAEDAALRNSPVYEELKRQCLAQH